MKIVIAGGSGFLGQPLAKTLAAARHTIVILTRTPTPPPSTHARNVTWDPSTTGPWCDELEDADVVVNLAGESIAARRWSNAQKREILDSRLRATRALVSVIGRAAPAAKVFISGSAVGYYGPLGDEMITEAQPAGADFLAHVCQAWESEAAKARSATTRVACIRTGLVLDAQGGALPRMLLPFKLGGGGRLGSGRQYWPWIHLDDWVRLVHWAAETPSVEGPINATAPNPVTNAEFSKALGRALHRPSLVPTPGLALKVLLGEMADALLLSGQRAIPARSLALGFVFRYTEVDAALRAIFSR